MEFFSSIDWMLFFTVFAACVAAQVTVGILGLFANPVTQENFKVLRSLQDDNAKTAGDLMSLSERLDIVIRNTDR